LVGKKSLNGNGKAREGEELSYGHPCKPSRFSAMEHCVL